MDLEKSFLKNFLKGFNETPFSITFWDGEKFLVGNGTPLFNVSLKEPLRKKDLLTSTSLAFGEAYMNGSLEIHGDLYFALNTILKYIDNFSTDFKALPKIYHKITSKVKQKEEVTSHYDIGNYFYKLWLDETMTYSCAYFKENNDSLYDAQINKVNHILNKLNLKEGDSLLDIGCGWGTLLIEAAKKYKIKGLGITLSEEQYKEFKKKIEAENLQNLLDVKIMDYRELEKWNLSFDRVVSVGMIEHVGRSNYDLFFRNVNSVLKEQGVFLLHYISGLVESEGDAWIKKYIFPGGLIPTLREIISISANYKFYTLDVESLRLHYVKTLLEWYKNFENNLDSIKTMFDDEFIRMWRLYLCSCAAGFNNGVVDLHQILFTKGINNDIPTTRKYMYQDNEI